jgi:hypothetical protein
MEVQESDFIEVEMITGDEGLIVEKQDNAKKPKHYNSHPSGVECIDITKHMNFNLGNAVKYIWRCEDKGKKIEDLENAIQYLQYEIQLTAMKNREEKE